jgi:GNAT superfamily N-acetyltransferase
MDAKGPTATADAVEDYLRTLEAQDWGASLNAPEPRRKKPERKAANDSAPREAPRKAPSPVAPKPPKVKPPKPKPAPPVPKLRRAKPSDAARIAELIVELGHPIDAEQVAKNLAALKKLDELPLVVTLGDRMVGVCGVGKRVMINRAYPLGRITSLIVTEDVQGTGIGRMLVDAAEAWMRDAGCKLVEVTSNDKRAEAHAFYRHLGYERTSIRFAKKL